LRGEEKLGAELFQQKTEIADRDRQLSDAKATMDKYLRDYDALFARTQKVGNSQIPLLSILFCCALSVAWCGEVWSGLVLCIAVTATLAVRCVAVHQTPHDIDTGYKR
jgi:hypothetical protein